MKTGAALTNTRYFIFCILVTFWERFYCTLIATSITYQCLSPPKTERNGGGGAKRQTERKNERKKDGGKIINYLRRKHCHAPGEWQSFPLMSKMKWILVELCFQPVATGEARTT